MFGLLSRKTKNARPAPRASRPARLGLEALEARWVPAPVIVLNVSYGVVRFITLDGTLRGGVPSDANQSIRITGEATGTATTDAHGHFSITLSADGLGNVNAQTADGTSNVATVTLDDPGPTMTDFQPIELPNDRFELKGTLTYPRPFDSMQVNLGGGPKTLENGITTQADGTGTFDLCVTLDGTDDDNGSVFAKAVDAWDVTSNTVWITIHQTGT